MELKNLNEPMELLKVVKTFYKVSYEFYKLYDDDITFMDFEIKKNLNNCILFIESMIFKRTNYIIILFQNMKKDISNNNFENIFKDLEYIIQKLENLLFMS